ncbi:MAG: NYN domain-containing protein [Deltaproteobacteria bacterium]|nr:NYN domain-containing protein [Deltaproteobacteria bacterium]
MRLLIDGYNLIHHDELLANAHARGEGREALLEALRLYRKTKPHQMTVVFDGGVEPGPRRHSQKGVGVVFSGASGTADDYIAGQARKLGQGLTVVTEDRELTQRCQGTGAEVISSRVFAARLWEAAMYAGALGADEEDRGGWDFTTRKKGPARRLPKAARRKKKRLDDL